MTFRTLLAAITLVVVTPVSAQTFDTEKGRIAVSAVAGGLDQPWGIDFLPDGQIIVTEKAGQLRIVSADGKVSPPVKGLPRIDDSGQGGLLDVTLHPDFASNRLVFLSYSEGGQGGASTAMASGRLTADGTALENVNVLFSQTPKVSGGRHFGSRVVFAPDGNVFLTTGDRGARHNAQKLDGHIGKVIRLTPDGRVPYDNPFVGKAGVLPEIWSYGHRNIQGAAIHPDTGRLWTIEHGPRGGDEINIPAAGANHGWPVVTHGIEYFGGTIGDGLKTKAGMADPIYIWTPVIAPGGMTFYTGELFPAWKGNLLIGGLRAGALVRLELDGDKVVREERLLHEIGDRIRDVAVGPDGAVYAITDAGDGKILRISPAK
jgi:aldose sugar dehydrogenase